MSADDPDTRFTLGLVAAAFVLDVASCLLVILNADWKLALACGCVLAAATGYQVYRRELFARVIVAAMARCPFPPASDAAGTGSTRKIPRSHLPQRGTNTPVPDSPV